MREAGQDHQQKLLAVEIAYALLQLADLGSAHNIFISLNRGVTAFEHAALPGEELGWGNRDPGRLLEQMGPAAFLAFETLCSA